MTLEVCLTCCEVSDGGSFSVCKTCRVRVVPQGLLAGVVAHGGSIVFEGGGRWSWRPPRGGGRIPYDW